MMKNTITRCQWVPQNNLLYQKYHDEEWGVPVHDDQKHFEFLILEGAQAGLTWLTILKRREGYKKSFANFDPKAVASFNEENIQELLINPEIIRNQLKIRAAVNNARQFLKIQKEFGSFDQYIWSFVEHKPIKHAIEKLQDYPVQIPEAENLSLDLKKRGFKFIGPKIIYAHIQACGLVDDHMECCFRRRS